MHEYIKYTFPPKRTKLGYPDFLWGKILKMDGDEILVEFSGHLFYEPVEINIIRHSQHIEFLTKKEFLVRKVMDS